MYSNDDIDNVYYWLINCIGNIKCNGVQIGNLVIRGAIFTDKTLLVNILDEGKTTAINSIELHFNDNRVRNMPEFKLLMEAYQDSLQYEGMFYIDKVASSYKDRDKVVHSAIKRNIFTVLEVMSNYRKDICAIESKEDTGKYIIYMIDVNSPLSKIDRVTFLDERDADIARATLDIPYIKNWILSNWYKVESQINRLVDVGLCD